MVEVDVRTAVAHHFGQAYGAFGHTDPANFYTPPTRRPGAHHPRREFKHSEWLRKLRQEADRSKELFIDHFRNTYTNFPDLPIWVATEIMSFGSLSKMCEGMLRHNQQTVAIRYGVQREVLLSWAEHLTVVRNHCAHHCRVWDRLWSVAPVLPAGPSWQMPYLPSNTRLSVTLLLLYHLLRRCPAAGSFPYDWHQRVSELLADPPTAPNALGRMGITGDWASGPRWT